jgi:hypothetical protein
LETFPIDVAGRAGGQSQYRVLDNPAAARFLALSGYPVPLELTNTGEPARQPEQVEMTPALTVTRS